MAKQYTRWDAPTCKCSMILEWDDAAIPTQHILREQVNLPDGRVIKSAPCSFHAGSHWQDTTWLSEAAPQVEENLRIMRALTIVMGVTAMKPAQWGASYDVARTLLINIPSLTTIQKGQAQVLANAQMGAGKVLYDNKVAAVLGGP